MHFFDYTFLSTGSVPMTLVNATNAISEIKALDGMRASRNRSLFDSLAQIARVQSVKTSNELEGIVTSDARIAAIVNQSSAPLDHDEQEIAGYRDALDFVHQHHADLQINEEAILHLHGLLLGHTGQKSSGYKKTDNVIADFDSQGRRRVRFRPSSAKDTPDDMEQLVLAYAIAHDEMQTNRLLLIPCFILDFLCIHPFSDGNGRLSRLLSLLMLYKEGYEVGKYVSFEEQVNKRKAWYYDALETSSEGWHENANNYTPFMENFVSTLLSCYRELDKRLALVRDSPGKAQRVERVVLNSLFPISKAEIKDCLPDVSPSTIETVLGKMVRDGTAKKIGTYRNARYIRN